MYGYVDVDPVLRALRVGYGHFWVGSVKLDADEVAVYKRALSK